MRITVVGDTLLDVDVAGTAERLSPDGPVPVIDVDRTTRRAGGAGLVATMLARDGHDVGLVTALADDESSGRLREALGNVTVVAGDSHAPTPVKTRLRVDGQAVARVDEGCGPAPVPEATDAMLEAIATADAIVVADYGRGLTENRALWEALRRRGTRVPLVWDPHRKGADPVGSATAVTPNLAEARALAQVAETATDGAARAAATLHERWGCKAVIVTMGESGALLFAPRATEPVPLIVPAPDVTVHDPCGAGDRLAASLTVALASGADLEGALHRGVSDAVAFLANGGVAGVDRPRSPRLLGGATEALTVARETRLTGGTVVATGGCFDLLHAGHARTLSAARRLGACLIVCLNSDASIRRLKGPGRPIVGQEDRVDLLLSLECVDGVLVFDEDTPEAAIRRLQPDLWVKGGDYEPADLPEAALLTEWGGRAVTVPYYPDRSTTGLARALADVG